MFTEKPLVVIIKGFFYANDFRYLHLCKFSLWIIYSYINSIKKKVFLEDT